jgi:hypothetical protein
MIIFQSDDPRLIGPFILLVGHHDLHPSLEHCRYVDTILCEMEREMFIV